jgi:hypothetical protein
MSDENVNAPVAFSCFNCFFAELSGESQVGCSLGLIDKYRAQTEVELRDGFFSVVGRAGCRTFRHKDSVVNPPDNFSAQVFDEASFTFDLVMSVDKTESDFVQVIDFARNIVNGSKVKPLGVYFVLRPNTFLASDFWVEINKNPLGVPFYITTIQEDCNHLKAIDEGVSKCTAEWVWTIRSVDFTRYDFIDRANYLINHKLDRFVLTDMGNGSLTRRDIFNTLGGNVPVLEDPERPLKNYVDKVMYFADKDQHHYLIKNNRHTFYEE